MKNLVPLRIILDNLSLAWHHTFGGAKRDSLSCCCMYLENVIYGGMIIDFLLAAEKYSGYDITEIKEQIEDKRLWLKATFPDAYQAEVGRDKPFFD